MATLCFQIYIHAGIHFSTIPPRTPFLCGFTEMAVAVITAVLLLCSTFKVAFVYTSLSSAAFLCHWQPFCLSSLEFREFPGTCVAAVLGSLLPLFNSFCQLSYHCWLQRFICCRQQSPHMECLEMLSWLLPMPSVGVCLQLFSCFLACSGSCEKALFFADIPIHMHCRWRIGHFL